MIFTVIIIENEYFVLKQLERLPNSIAEIDLKGAFSTEKQTWLAKNTMKNIEKRFCQTGRFIRISQSVIIAINKLGKIHENRKLVLTNGVEFLISGRYLKQLQDMLSRSNF